MIDERAHGNLLHQLRHATGVVGMIVGQQHIVDLAHARVFGGCGNAFGVKAVVPCPSGIDQQRLPCRGYEERRLPAVHVDEIDLQIACSHCNACTAKYERYQNSSQESL